MKEVTIKIPDNCELVKSDDSYIIRERKREVPKSWGEFCAMYPDKIGAYYINSYSNIVQCLGVNDSPRSINRDKNICASKEEAEAFLALIQLRQLRKAWVGDWEQPGSYTIIGVILYNIDRGKVIVDTGGCFSSRPLSFPTKEMADEFYKYFSDLIEKAKILI